MQKFAAAGAIAAAIVLAAPALAQEKLEIVTLPAGSVAHGAGSGIAGVVSQKTKLKILAAPFAGPQVVVPQVDAGKAAFTLINVFDTHNAYTGKKPDYKKAHRNLRLVSVGYENTGAALVRVESGIASVKDLKGKRAAGLYSAHKTCGAVASAVLANWGLTWKDVRVVPVPSVVPGVAALGEKRVDVTPCGALNMGIVREINVKSPIRFLPANPDKAAMDAARKEFTGMRAKLFKKGSAEGILQDQHVMVYDFYMLSHAGMAEETVYTLVKAIWENLPEIQKTHGALRTWTREGMASADVTAPYHDGAVRWFKEAKVWTPDMEAARAKLLGK
ncbi:MAG: TAXI family TRAP transporter solute-binding subunit [Beijerinckiaceae bacterium]